MRLSRTIITVLILSFWATISIAQHQINLKNGNQIAGEIQLAALKLRTGVGLVDVPIRDIVSIQGNSIKLGDGTVLTGGIVTKTIPVKTRFGLVTVQSQEIAELSPAGSVESSPTERQVAASRNRGSFMSPTKVTSAVGPTVRQAQAEDALGPKKRVAIRRFENKTAIASHGQYSIGTGMVDMLTTAMVNTGRFIVLEREQMNDVLTEQNFGASGRVRGNTAARVGDVEGAELLIYGAVTDYMADQSGVQAAAGNSAGVSIGALFGPLGMIVGAIAGGVAGAASAQKAHVTIDLRLVDAQTGRIVSATTVQGTPKSFGAEISFGSFGGAGFSKTPIGLAIRDCIENAVHWMLITSFPDEKDQFIAERAAKEASIKSASSSKEQADSAVQPTDKDRSDQPNSNSSGGGGISGFFSRLLPEEKK